MARPRTSTVDAFIDTFDSWDIETQERVMDQLQLVQRLAKRRAGKKEPADTAAVVDLDTLIEQRAAVLNGVTEFRGKQ